MKRFVQTFDGIITVDATKSLSNSCWKLLLTIMTTLTRHSRDNDKMEDRVQKWRALTKFVQTYMD